MVLVKGILLHVLQKKSWRQAGAELKVSYTALYQFAQFFESREEKKELLSYLIERKIALYIANEGHITMDVLSGDEIVQESLLELNRRV